jgi:hypothetical protein
MDQEELVKIFGRLKTLLKKYEGDLAPKFDLDSKYDLWSFKDVEIAGRKRKEVYFAGLIIQSAYVGFYYMPIYDDSSLKNVFHPDLMKLLKGKSCFHVKKLDEDLEKHIEFALEKGYELYLKRDWI